MLSDNSDNSDYTKKEIDYAKNIGKRVIPVIIDGGELRGWFLFEFGKIHYFNIRNKEQIAILIRDLKLFLGIEDRHIITNKDNSNNKLSIVVYDNKITLDIIDEFSFVLEKEPKKDYYLGNIPVREIIDVIKSRNIDNGAIRTYL